MKRSFRSALLALLIAACLLAAFPICAQAEEQPQINADCAVIFNADDDGEILYGKNEKMPVYCGFLPRVTACLVALESGIDPETTVTMTKEMLVHTPQVSNVQLSVGDTISIKDLIACVLIGNSQEAAVALAFGVAGSTKAMVEKMNETAEGLGANDTLFTNVTGKYVSNTRQITTLTDCAVLLSAALEHELILSPATQRAQKITVNGKTRTVYTRNYLIETTSSEYNKDANGLFIYYESASNGSIATYRKDSDRKIISLAVSTKGLGSLYKDAGALLEFSKDRYVTRTLLSKGKPLTEVKVTNGKEADYVVLTAAEEIIAFVPKIYNEQNVTLTFDVPETLHAPVEQDAVLGTVTVSCGGKVYGVIDLKVQSGVALDYFELYSAKIGNFFSNPWLWTVLAGLLAAIGGYTFLAYRINRPRKKKRASAAQTGARIRMTGSEDDDDE